MNPAEIIERFATEALTHRVGRADARAAILWLLDAIREPSEGVLGAMWRADLAAEPKHATYTELYRAGIDQLKREVAG